MTIIIDISSLSLLCLMAGMGYVPDIDRNIMDSDFIRKKEIYRVTFVGSVVNLLLLLLKFAAGILGRSAAMIADAVHSLSDFITDIVVLAFVKISSKPQDEDHDYGHGKYETLATAIIGIVLMIVGVGIFYSGAESVFKVINGEVLPEPGMWALVVAVVSIVITELLYRYTITAGRRLNSPAVEANAWHHRSDAMSSIATATGIGGAVLLGENWRVLDPIAAVIVSVFIVKVSLRLIGPCVDDLLEKSLPADIEADILTVVASIEKVREPHHLCTRRIGTNYAIELHVRMSGDMSLTEAHAVATEIENRLKARYGAGTHVAIHMEPA